MGKTYFNLLEIRLVTLINPGGRGKFSFGGYCRRLHKPSRVRSVAEMEIHLAQYRSGDGAIDSQSAT